MQGGEARRGLTRRQVLIGGATVGAAAALGVATTGSPFKGGAADGHVLAPVRRRRRRAADRDPRRDRRRARRLDVRQLILQWGNPYYTKLALAAVGGSPPDVAIVHATRIPSFAPAGLLEELTPELLEPHGLSGDRFLEKPWQSCQSDGRQYAIPLDTHPFVLYYNTELTEKAGPARRRQAAEAARRRGRRCWTPARRSRRRPARAA